MKYCGFEILDILSNLFGGSTRIKEYKSKRSDNSYTSKTFKISKVV